MSIFKNENHYEEFDLVKADKMIQQLFAMFPNTTDTEIYNDGYSDCEKCYIIDNNGIEFSIFIKEGTCFISVLEIHNKRLKEILGPEYEDRDNDRMLRTAKTRPENSIEHSMNAIVNTINEMLDELEDKSGMALEHVQYTFNKPLIGKKMPVRGDKPRRFF